ncbi:hypothetical protein SNEBB_004521 [Seison nebaliae]|nr:hypothetical protein SNEBB_004521 [Seison nebaliae]
MGKEFGVLLIHAAENYQVQNASWKVDNEKLKGKFKDEIQIVEQNDSSLSDLNGLPAVSSSIQFLGRAQQTRWLRKQKNLVQIIDVLRRQGNLIVVQEHSDDNLLKEITRRSILMDIDYRWMTSDKCSLNGEDYSMDNCKFHYGELVWVIHSLLSAVKYLHENEIIHGLISLNNCLIIENEIKVTNWNVFHSTDYGELVEFPVAYPQYMAPERWMSMAEEMKRFLMGEHSDQLHDILIDDVRELETIISSSSLGNGNNDHQQEKYQRQDKYLTKKLDVWSMGVICLELVASKKLWDQKPLKWIISRQKALWKNPLFIICNDLQLDENDIPKPLYDFICRCLQLMPSKRASTRELWRHPIFKLLNQNGVIENGNIMNYQFIEKSFDIIQVQLDNEVKCRSDFINDRYSFLDDDLEIFSEFNWIDDVNNEEIDNEKTEEAFLRLEKHCQGMSDHFYKEHSLDDIYYYWRLSGGDPFTVLEHSGRMTPSQASILRLPELITSDGSMYGMGRDTSSLFNDEILIVNVDTLINQLEDYDKHIFYPFHSELDEVKNSKEIQQFIDDKLEIFSLMTINNNDKVRKHCQLLFENEMNVKNSSINDLPAAVKETNIAYQMNRCNRIDRLLSILPISRKTIFDEISLHGIPSKRRQITWMVLLAIPYNNLIEFYKSINRIDPNPSTKQIEVDVPRCHQYDELMASPTAHQILKRILLSWCVSHDGLTYWQGLDSLTAPFVHLHFGNEALAYHSLNAFIPRYLNYFFIEDNTVVIQEYLAVFKNFLSFHDPELANHLKAINFVPNLYAIPWFLTMFAHVFPLYQIFYVWDQLLLNDSSFPICIGISLLLQLRRMFLKSEFNECILLFGELPDVDIEHCTSMAIQLKNRTPFSCLQRFFSRKQFEVLKSNNFIPFPDDKKIDKIMKDHYRPFHEIQIDVCCTISALEVYRLMIKENPSMCNNGHFGSNPLEKANELHEEWKELMINAGHLSLATYEPSIHIILIDSRSEKKFQMSHIHQSYHLNFDQKLFEDLYVYVENSLFSFGIESPWKLNENNESIKYDPSAQFYRILAIAMEYIDQFNDTSKYNSFFHIMNSIKQFIVSKPDEIVSMKNNDDSSSSSSLSPMRHPNGNTPNTKGKGEKTKKSLFPYHSKKYVDRQKNCQLLPNQSKEPDVDLTKKVKIIIPDDDQITFTNKLINFLLWCDCRYICLLKDGYDSLIEIDSFISFK